MRSPDYGVSKASEDGLRGQKRYTPAASIDTHDKTAFYSHERNNVFITADTTKRTCTTTSQSCSSLLCDGVDMLNAQQLLTQAMTAGASICNF